MPKDVGYSMPAAPENDELDLGLEEFGEEEAAPDETEGEAEMVEALEEMGYTVIPPDEGGDEEGMEEDMMDEGFPEEL